jgi:plastocyanin
MSVPLWFNGQPSIEIPPEHAFPQGGPAADGKTYRNSGLSAPAFAPYTLKFPKQGSYKYLCLVHPGMDGRVKVLPKSSTIPSARADRKARVAEYGKALKRSKKLAKLKPKGNNVVAGSDAGSVAWFRFFPATRTIKAGESVHFSITSKSEIHTMSFGPQATSDFVMVQPQPSGPPRLQFSPLVIMPSDFPLPPYTGSNHGNGFFNTGVIDVNPQSPNPSSVDVTFRSPGSYLFECTIHPGMQGTIKVE